MALPKLCLHKASGQWFVFISGRRILAEAAAGVVPQKKSAVVSIGELADAYLQHCDTYYRRADGSATSEAHNIAVALRPLVRLYGSTAASGSWTTTTEGARGRGWCRNVVNKAADRVRRCFAWAVPNLKRGRSPARETEAVQAVSQEHIDAVRPYLTPQVWAMVQFQLLTGARPGEVCSLCGADLGRTGERLRQLAPGVQMSGVWAYLPPQHKTAHHGHARVIPIGPQA